MNDYEKIRQLIINQTKAGRVCFNTADGIKSCNLSDFVNQSVDGILYDLNRGEETCLALANKNDYFWINDLACALVIRELKKKVEKYEEKYGKL